VLSIEFATGVCERIAPGASIIDEGRPPSALFLVLDGTLAATTAALDGGEIARLMRCPSVGNRGK